MISESKCDNGRQRSAPQTPRQKRVLCRYESGEPVESIAQAEAVCVKTVRNIARRAGLPPRRAEVQAEARADIVRRYELNEPVNEIAKRHGVRRNTVWTIAKNAGCEPHSDWQRQYPVNHSAFDNPGPVGWWLVGLLAADGCVIPRVNRVTLSQRDEDRDVLDEFLRFVGSEGRPLTRIRPKSEWSRPDARYWEARVWSRPMCDSLIALGVTPRKSQSLEFSPEAASQTACWLGLLDGDGSVGLHSSHGRPRIDFFGAEPVMRQCSAFWAEHLEFQRAAFPAVSRHRGGLSKVYLHGANAARAAAQMLEASPISMRRKRRCLEQVAEFKPVHWRDKSRQATSI